MRICTTLLMVVCLLFPILSHAQHRDCATMHHHHQLLEKSPNLQEQMNAIEAHTRTAIHNGFAARSSNSIIEIPIVVHVLYNTDQENISDAQIQSQIDVLNEDFRRLNDNANNNWAQAADVEIEFCLTEITRKQTGRTSWTYDDSMKYNASGGVDAWDAREYLNIWVCNLTNNLLGYAQFPGGPRASDGVVVRYNAFGRQGTLMNNYDLGKTTTHEVGHWLNLRHIWGDGDCSYDDFVSDTPPADAPHYFCTAASSCGGQNMIENYMDYTFDACQSLFTEGQKARMRALFQPGGFRSGFMQVTCSGGEGEPTPTCNDGIQNGDETGVDCGGNSCAPCITPPTCNDGIQNGDETGIDCGGSNCAPCMEEEDGACADPSNLQNHARRDGRVYILEWDFNPDVWYYNIEIREVETNSYLFGRLSYNRVAIKGLVPGRTYEWGLQSLCPEGESNWVKTSFVAGGNGRARNAFTTNFDIYPNPTSNYIKMNLEDLDFTEVEESLNFNKNTVISNNRIATIIDCEGKACLSKILDKHDTLLEMDVRHLTPGIYFLQLDEGEGNSITQQFVVQ